MARYPSWRPVLSQWRQCRVDRWRARSWSSNPFGWSPRRRLFRWVRLRAWSQQPTDCRSSPEQQPSTSVSRSYTHVGKQPEPLERWSGSTLTILWGPNLLQRQRWWLYWPSSACHYPQNSSYCRARWSSRRPGHRDRCRLRCQHSQHPPSWRRHGTDPEDK